ncbi:MAG: HEAT repeat domain-containing protein, partial [Candidatus Hydrogenedentes bacterium]|nr:HEAT repeat domain-containing protein [Candidatus Hydrogenedentota bacterium]
MRVVPAAVMVMCLFSAGAALAQGVPAADLNELIAYLKGYDFGESREPLTRLSGAIRAAHGNAAQLGEIEKQLDAVLSGDCTLEAKRYASRELSLVGTAASVPALAALLNDAATNDIAVKTLETRPAPEAGAALREAAQSLSGNLHHAVVQALGRRGDAEALSVLAGLSQKGDEVLAIASINAIADIGGMSALDTLEGLRPTAPDSWYPALRDAYLKVAESVGDSGTSQEIYGELYKPEHPAHVRAAALGGLVAADPAQALQVVSRALTDDEPGVAHIAIGYMRRIPGPEATAKFASLLKDAAPETQILLLDALTERGDGAAREAVMAAAQSEDELVKLAAVEALGKLGDASAVPMLLTLAEAAPGEARRIAREALSTLPGEGVDAALLLAAQQTDAQALEAIRALAERRAVDTKADLLGLAANKNAQGQQEILKAMTVLADVQDIAALLTLLEQPDAGVQREAGRALAAVVQRAHPVEQGLDPVLAAYSSAQQPETKAVLLEVIGSVPSDKALETVRAALKSEQDPVRTAAVKSLAARTDPQALDDLLQVAEASQSVPEKAAALSGYVKILRANAAAFSTADLLERYGHVLDLSPAVPQKKALLGALSEVAALGAFALIEKAGGSPDLKAEADLATVKVAQTISGVYPQDALQRVEPILAAGGADQALRDQAQAVKAAVGAYGDYLVAWEMAG